MIAKFKNRVDFSGIVDYAHDRKSEEKRARVIGYQGVCIVSNETISDSFNTHLRTPDSRGRVHKIGQPVKHISISFSPEDAARFPDNEEGDRFMTELVEEWLHGIGIDNAQYLIARHFDKPHPHCHLVYSRIDLDGNVISAFNEQKRNIDVCKEIKIRHHLTFGNSTGEEVNRDRLRDVHQVRFDIKTAAIRAAESTTSWTEFQRMLEADCIEASFSINRSSGEIRGVSFAKGDFKFAGSKLAKQKLTYGKLAAKFGKLPVEGVVLGTTPSAQGVRDSRTPSKIPSEKPEGVSKTATLSQEGVTKTDTPINHSGGESGPTLIPLTLIIELLSGGPAVQVASGGGGTSSDLGWNDERRRRQEAQENRKTHNPYKLRR